MAVVFDYALSMTIEAQSAGSELAESFARRMRSPTSPTLSRTEEMRQRLLERTAASLSAQGIKEIALFGAGRHTRPIVRQPWVRFGIRVRLIIDDQPRAAAMGGIPVVLAEAVELPKEVGAVVISSQFYEQQLFERAREVFGGTGVPILRLYGNDDEAYEAMATLDRLRKISDLSNEDAEWLVENRGERHDAMLPMLPPARTELHIRRYELAGELLERIGGMGVADLACGTGYGAEVLTGNHAVNYFGVDIDAHAVQYANGRYGGEGRHFFCASAHAIPIENEVADLVASFETIEHIEDTPGLCAEYARILTPHGLLVVSTPNKLGPTPFHVHDFDLKSFVDALSSHFEIVDLFGQLPIDDVFDAHLPPGMWRIDPLQVNAEAIGDDGRRPDFLIAVAKHRGTSSPDGLEPVKNDEAAVLTKHGRIRFYCPSGATHWRAQTLLTKEPETLDWIDQFDEGDVYWDIGASTGPYVMYAAAAGRASRIIAFEPSPWSWWVLAEQIRRAGLDEQIQAYPIAVNDGANAGTLHMRHPIPGGAGSSFGDPVGESGETFVPSFTQGAIGISIDELVEQFGLATPHRLKIDVDGIEEKVLMGGRATLKDPKLKSIIVELDSRRSDLIERVTGLMSESGLSLVSKGQSAMAQGMRSEDIRNFIFTRVGEQK